MKRILALIAILMMAGQASALTITWSAANVAFEGTKLTKSTDVTGYLIYLGGAGSAYSTSYTLADGATGDSVAASIGTVVDTKAGTTMSRVSQSFSFTTDKYNNGDVFGMLLTYSKEGTTYFNLSSATVSMTGAADDPPTNPENAVFSFNYGGPSESSSLSKGGGWTAAVPEPSTAALALAGLALLIKRRRA